jgi:hypothetical protein
MPIWLELLLDVLGFVGFLVIATRSPRSKGNPVRR